MHNRILKLIGAFLFIIILALSAVLISAVVFPKETVIVPHISPDLIRSQSSPIIISHQFPFEKTTVTLTLPINVSVYEGAKQAEKATTVYGNISDTSLACAKLPCNGTGSGTGQPLYSTSRRN